MADDAVRDIPEDIVERATGVLNQVHSFLSTHDLAVAVLSAALAGRTVVSVADPTAQPDPRRWGVELRTGKRQRVYWDASLAARRENAWTNIARTERFTADVVQADANVPGPALPFDARDRIERALADREPWEQTGATAHRIMQALTESVTQKGGDTNG